MLRVWFKQLICRFMVIGEFCKTCGAKVEQIWYADDPLWMAITGNAYTIRCIRCFDLQASKRGALVRWHATDYDPRSVVRRGTDEG